MDENIALGDQILKLRPINGAPTAHVPVSIDVARNLTGGAETTGIDFCFHWKWIKAILYTRGAAWNVHRFHLILTHARIVTEG
jgi:hypothetical protein